MPKFLKHPLFLIIVLFLLTRLVNLTLLPVFSDEALYIEWGWRELTIPGQAFHSLYDAKQPFLMWFFGLGQIIFPDPLFGSRLASVICGLISLLGLWQLSKKFFDPKIVILSTLVYCLVPNFVFYDRQALMESALVASVIWSVYFLLQLLHTQKLKYSLFLGLSLGLGFFTKNTAAVFLVTTLLIILFQSFKHKNLFYALSLSQISILLTFILVNISLFFQPMYWQTLSSNSRWTFTLLELLKFPISQWLSNTIGNLELIIVHFTPPLAILFFVGLYQALTGKHKHLKILAWWFLVSVFFFLVSLRFMNFMSWRYQTPFLAIAPILIAYPLSKLHKYLQAIVFVFPALFSLILIFNPVGFFRLQNQLTRFSYIDGYVTAYDTGYQLNAIVDYLKARSRKSPILVGIGMHSFNPESGIWDYFRKDPNVTVSYLDSKLFDPGILDKIDCLTLDKPFYFVAKLNDTVGLEKFFTKVAVITNPYNPDYSTIYTFKTNCPGKTVFLNLTNSITH
jgi:4-amino-4-deoxy-L-arabinose transferase-like glycosyltransferase